MNKKLRPTKSPYQLKDEQVNFMLEKIQKKTQNTKNNRNKGQTASRSKKNTERRKK